MVVYTVGIWTAKPGREEDFVRAWNDLATRTKSDFPDATAMLLRDSEQPNLFVSFGPWDSIDQIEVWRSSDTFRDGVGGIRELVDGFVPHTMDSVARIE